MSVVLYLLISKLFSIYVPNTNFTPELVAKTTLKIVSQIISISFDENTNSLQETNFHLEKMIFVSCIYLHTTQRERPSVQFLEDARVFFPQILVLDKSQRRIP